MTTPMGKLRFKPADFAASSKDKSLRWAQCLDISPMISGSKEPTSSPLSRALLKILVSVFMSAFMSGIYDVKLNNIKV